MRNTILELFKVLIDKTEHRLIVAPRNGSIMIDIDGYRYFISPERGSYEIRINDEKIYEGYLPELLMKLREIDNLIDEQFVHASILLEESLNKPVIPIPPSEIGIMDNEKVKRIKVEGHRPIEIVKEVKKKLGGEVN